MNKFKAFKYFISCDWGTSNFRLAVVKIATLSEVFTHRAEVGVKDLYNEFLQQSEYTQNEYFSNYFISQLEIVPAEYDGYPIVISGMASANIGLQEMDYAIMPISGDGRSLVHCEVTVSANKKAVLISGARSENGVMRGEEVQAVGLADLIATHGSGTLVLPGTHSKHLIFHSGKYEELMTFMTGELFALLSKDSILSNSIKETKWDLRYESDFLEGVQIGLKGKLTEKLFSIRVNGLLGRKGPEGNYFLLSGMIIGDEVRHLEDIKGAIFLAAVEPLIEMYSLAIQHSLKKDKLVIFDSEITRKATLRGQLIVLSNCENFGK